MHRRRALAPAVLLAVQSVSYAAAPNWHKAIDLVWFGQNVDQRTLDMTLDNLAAIGVDHVATNVWWFQNNISSTTIAPNFGLYSSTDSTVTQVINSAHSHGMSVELRPLVDLSNDSTHWRGQITGGNTWFNGVGGYGDYMRHMADIAQSTNCELFSMGVELEGVASQEANWRSLISSVKTHYTGPLTYAANWGNPAIGSPINWWDAVDYMGIDAYYPLTNINNPTPAQLQSAWATRVAQIEAYRNSVAPTKNVIYTEAGYVNQDGTNQIPYGTPSGSANDQKEQADCYAALLGQNVPKSWFNGVYWWDTDLNPNPNAIGYETMGKLAFDTMASYYTAGYTLGGSWTGTGGATWSNIASWSNSSAPGNLTTANFTGAGGGNTNINLGGPITVARLIFDGATTAAYSFQAGNTLTFNPGGGVTITDTVTATQTLNCAVSLLGPAIFANGSSTVNQKLIVNGAISGASAGLKRISMIGVGSGQLNGGISDGAGTVALYKAGGGTWTIAGNNSFSGETAIMGGNLYITHSNALGSGAGGTYVADNASLQLGPSLNITSEPIQITGFGSGGQGAMTRADLSPYDTVTWGGTITLNGSAEIHNRAFNPGTNTNVFVISGKITGGSAGTFLRLRSSNSAPGFFKLTNPDNDYLGKTQIAGGKVILAGADDILPTTTVVELDTYGRAVSVEAGVLDLNGTNQTLGGLTQITEATQPRVVNRLAGTTSVLTISNSADLSFTGNLQNVGGTLALAKSGLNTQVLSGSNSYSGGTTVSGGALVFSNVNAAGTGPLNVSAGTAIFSAALPMAIKLPSVQTSSPGRVDLKDNDLVIDYAGASPIISIATQLGSAYNNAAWTGAGITSATAATVAADAFNTHKTALGFAENAALGLSTFSGQSVDGTSILIRYTYFGDSNLSGNVDSLDFNALAGNFGTTGKSWVNGDFNFDGAVDSLDFNALASNFGLTLPASIATPVGANVPEPGLVPLMLLQTLFARRPRRLE